MIWLLIKKTITQLGKKKKDFNRNAKRNLLQKKEKEERIKS